MNAELLLPSRRARKIPHAQRKVPLLGLEFPANRRKFPQVIRCKSAPRDVTMRELDPRVLSANAPLEIRHGILSLRKQGCHSTRHRMKFERAT